MFMRIEIGKTADVAYSVPKNERINGKTADRFTILLATGSLLGTWLGKIKKGTYLFRTIGILETR